VPCLWPATFWARLAVALVFFSPSRKITLNDIAQQWLTSISIIYGYFEIAAKEGDMAGLKGMVMG